MARDWAMSEGIARDCGLAVRRAKCLSFTATRPRSCLMETDPKKLRELRLKMSRMTSAEVREQFERNQRDASRMLEFAKQKRSEPPRVRET